MLFSTTHEGLVPERFFSAPHAGRKILAGFSYMQRIGKGARTQLWIPPSMDGKKVEWAAIRQFELLQEADNLYIDDLKISDMKRAFQIWGKMRAGGYRVTLLTLGHYTQEATDDLYLLDTRLQEEITRLIRVFYLREQSAHATQKSQKALDTPPWHYEKALPHVALTLGAQKLFKSNFETEAQEAFFKILEKIPPEQIMHEVAIGLDIPEAEKNKNWVYIAKGEHRAAAFFHAIGAALGESITPQMRGYGDHFHQHHRPMALVA